MSSVPSVDFLFNYYFLYNFCSSDELLLQEDVSDMSCIVTDFSKSVDLGSAESSGGRGRFNHLSSASSSMSSQRCVSANPWIYKYFIHL